jgi:RNA polymerase sigma-70 factor (ECF subfamily)
VNALSEAVDGMKVSQTDFDFEEVFRAQFGRITRVIARVVRDYARAEELAAEVFWKLIRNPQAQGDQCVGWLHRTAVRMSLNEIRREARRAGYERLFGFPRGMANPEEAHALAEQQQRVRSVLASIDQRQAELLLLRNEGLSYQGLASTLDLNPASVGTYLSRAQQAFRKEYFKRYGKQ